MRFRYALGFPLLLAASVLPTLGQYRSTGKNSFSGSVRDQSNQRPMGNIRVDLKQSTGITVNTTFTNRDGDFEFVGVSNGNYLIEIDVKGYEPIRQNVAIGNEARDGVSIFMSRSATVVSPSSAATISAHQLSVPHKAYDEYEKGIDLMYGKSDYQGAIVQFERAIKDFATYYEAYADMGNAYMRLREMASAEQALRKSIDLSSGRYTEALTILAGLLNSTNRYQEALTFAKKVTEVDASSWHGPYELARALFGLNQTEEAEKSAIQARDLNPTNPSVYLMLANIHIHLRDYPALLKDIDSYLKLEPSGPEADQARKLRDDLQLNKEQADQQANATTNATNDARGRPIVDAASPTHDKEQPPPLEPDSSGLPSLPPPSPSNP